MNPIELGVTKLILKTNENKSLSDFKIYNLNSYTKCSLKANNKHMKVIIIIFITQVGCGRQLGNNIKLCKIHYD